MIRVDGKDYDVIVTDVSLDTEFIYKYAERTKDFSMKYELGAVYFNQSFTFGLGRSNSDFSELWDLLSNKGVDNGTGHDVEIRTPIGKMTFLMYPNSISLKLVREKADNTWWTGMQVKFIAVKPARSW